MKKSDTRPAISIKKAEEYPRLLSEIKERIRCAQYQAFKAVNTELVGLYRDI